MERLFRSVFLIAISFITFPLWAQTDDAHTVRETRTVKYAAKDIIRVTTRPHFTTLILLPAQERILDFVIGDKDAWVLEGTQNFAYLKPSKPGLETSMNLITAAGNIYTFYCVSADAQPDLKLVIEPTDEKLLGAIQGGPRMLPASEVDQFREAAALEVKAAQEQSSRFRSEYAIHGLKFDYKFDQNKKPFNISTIYHDDRFTYIHSSAVEKPTLYEVKDGQPTLINFSLQDGVYLVDHIVDKGYLAIGKHKSTFERQGE
jgi:type IV secretion system protein VirB9